MRNSLFCKHRFFYLILLLSFGFTIALKAQILAGDKAPSLSFLEPLASDNITAPYSYDDQVTVVYFWATWCAPCIKEIPSLDRLKSKFEKNFDVIAISLDRDGKKKVTDFFNENKILFFFLVSSNKLINFAA